MASKIFEYPVRTENIIDFEKDEPEFDLLNPVSKQIWLRVLKRSNLNLKKKKKKLFSICMKAKLYRFDKDKYQWKERGVGFLKLLKHKQTEKVRVVMRQSNTQKICANHLVLPRILFLRCCGGEFVDMAHATDFSDGVLKDEVFCARFQSYENVILFKKMLIKASELQVQKSEESKELTEKLSVGGKKDVSTICDYASLFKEMFRKAAVTNAEI
ncbi:hypothetical protein MKW92_050454 [Papaver armeniacum]|nr:hypothetical protein MKW92_050454 [Papaver armeniacum]